MKKNIQISQPDTGEEEWLAVKEPLMSGWLTAGPKVKEFEQLFAKIHNVKHAVAVTSATTALHLALLALNIKKDDEVIVPAFTWVATANAVKYCGGRVVFVDIDKKTYNIDIEDLKRKISPKTKAIIAVHLFGLCADIPQIKKLFPEIPVIEDAACAAGARIHNQYAGGMGDIACFSFHPRKSITTGEGGIITTNNDKYAELVSKLRNHGAEISEEQRHFGNKPYQLPQFNLLGYNYRMTDIQAAIGIVQLKKLLSFISDRNKWAEFYTEHLSHIPWIIPPYVPDNYHHGWQAYVTYIDESKAPYSRNKIMEILQRKGVSTRPGTHAVHMLNYYKKNMKLSENDFPNARDCNNYTMAIPLHNKMTEEDYQYVIKSITEIK